QIEALLVERVLVEHLVSKDHRLARLGIELGVAHAKPGYRSDKSGTLLEQRRRALCAELPDLRRPQHAMGLKKFGCDGECVEQKINCGSEVLAFDRTQCALIEVAGATGNLIFSLNSHGMIPTRLQTKICQKLQDVQVLSQRFYEDFTS